MTRIPAPPMVILAADGSVGCWLRDDTLTVVDPMKAMVRSEVALPHEALSAALSPRGSFCAVAGLRALSLVETATGAVIATVPAPAPLFRIAIGEDRAVAAVARPGEHESALCRWAGPGLVPQFTGRGHALGATAPFTLFSAGGNRVLLGGRKGRGAFDGGGDPFIALVSDGDTGVTVEWKGDGLPFAPNGLRFPARDGSVLVYDLERVALVTLPGAGAPPRVLVDWAMPGVNSPALAPDGEWLAWLAGDEVLRIVPLSRGEVTAEVTVPLLDAFPSLAINDAGQVTIVSSARPAQLRFQRWANGVLEFCGEVEAPGWEE